jgi:hypothetical protein
MEKVIAAIVTFWLTFFVWQRKLFYRFWKDLGFMIKTLFSKVITKMKKVLYIVAKGRKQPGETPAPHVPPGLEKKEEAPQTQLPLPTIAENPIPDPMVVSTSEMETETTPSSLSPDVVIRVEMDHYNDGTPETITLGAAYHLATMEKLNTLVTGMNTIHERIENMALNLEALTAEVARVKGVHESAVTLIHRVTDELVDIKAALAAATAHVEPPVDTSALDALVADLKSSTDGLAAAVAANPPTHTVVLNAEDTSTPTVEVVLPEVMPEVVETTVEQIVETVDPASPEPQFTITVEEAAPAVVEAVEAAPAEVVAAPEETLTTSEGTVLESAVIETDPGLVDVVVTVPAEEAAPAEAAGVDVLESVQEAFEAAPEVTAEEVPTVTTTINADNPEIPTVEVVMPEVLPEVVTVTTEQIVETVDPASTEPQFTLTVEEAPAATVEAVEAVAPEVVADPAVTVPSPEGELATAVIETPAEQVNVTVAAPVEEVAAAAEAGVDVLATVEAAVEATPEVVAEEAPKTE